MPHPNVSSLFEPLTINRMALPNRFVMPAMQRGWCVNGVPLPKMADYYRERAEGGAGLIISEACAIDHPSATGQNPSAHIFGPAVASWARCVRAVKDAGGHMIVQLWHEGSMRRQGVEPQNFRLTVFFDGDTMTRYEGDEMPSETEFVDRLSPRKEFKVPPLEATEEQLARFPAPASPSASAAEGDETPVGAPAGNYPPLEAPR